MVLDFFQTFLLCSFRQDFQRPDSFEDLFEALNKGIFNVILPNFS